MYLKLLVTVPLTAENAEIAEAVREETENYGVLPFILFLSVLSALCGELLQFLYL